MLRRVFINEVEEFVLHLPGAGFGKIGELF
jgi:hypothetical protein